VNIYITVECETCGEKTNCRIGMSNREEQPFRFCCQSCGSPIDMILRQSKGGEFPRDAAYKKAVLGTTRARVAVEAAVELGWERYIGLEGRFVGKHSFGASAKIADVYKKFDINAEAVVRAAHETLAEVAAL
jgi:hypothetical protein